MWIVERNGKFKFTERYEDYLTGKTKYVSVTLDRNTAQSRKKAQQILTEKIASLQDGSARKKEITFGDLVEEYRAYQKVAVKESTYKRNYFACETMLRLFGRDILVERLTVNYINKKLLETGKDPGTLNEHLTRLRALIRWGYKNDLIEDIRFLNKLENYKDRPHREKIQNKYLERDELRLLLSKMDHEIWKLLTEFMCLSGLRFGEAAALTKTDVDFPASVIHVTKTYDSINEVVTSPKSLCSIRDVYMQPELFSLCKRINIYMAKLELLHGIRTNLFLHDNKGRIVSFFSFNKYLKNLSSRILDKRITSHALRHTHASLLLENGVSIDAISRRLGHENSKVTREIYLHVTQRLQKKDNGQIEKIKLL